MQADKSPYIAAVTLEDGEGLLLQPKTEYAGKLLCWALLISVSLHTCNSLYLFHCRPSLYTMAGIPKYVVFAYGVLKLIAAPVAYTTQYFVVPCDIPFSWA